MWVSLSTKKQINPTYLQPRERQLATNYTESWRVDHQDPVSNQEEPTLIMDIIVTSHFTAESGSGFLEQLERKC